MSQVILGDFECNQNGDSGRQDIDHFDHLLAVGTGYQVGEDELCKGRVSPRFIGIPSLPKEGAPTNQLYFICFLKKNKKGEFPKKKVYC